MNDNRDPQPNRRPWLQVSLRTLLLLATLAGPLLYWFSQQLDRDLQWSGERIVIQLKADGDVVSNDKVWELEEFAQQLKLDLSKKKLAKADLLMVVDSNAKAGRVNEVLQSLAGSDALVSSAIILKEGGSQASAFATTRRQDVAVP